jgi:hypothetical protein
VAANGRLPHFHLPDDTEEKLRSSAFDSMDKTMTIVGVMCLSSVHVKTEVLYGTLICMFVSCRRTIGRGCISYCI